MTGVQTCALPICGNIFVRQSLKDTPREEILRNDELRAMLIEDMLDELSEKVIRRSTVFQLVKKFRPGVIIDCINSATAIAYQDIFQSARNLLSQLGRPKPSDDGRSLRLSAEMLICTLYTPQLIRHVQLLYRSMHATGTHIYVKIGTSGTGGMGLNIPYTHSEEKPSSVLLGKSAIAGAHTSPKATHEQPLRPIFSRTRKAKSCRTAATLGTALKLAARVGSVLTRRHARWRPVASGGRS